MKMRLLCRLVTGLFALSAASVGPSARMGKALTRSRWRSIGTRRRIALRYFAAIKLGYYKEQNLDVELLPLAGSIPAVVSVTPAMRRSGRRAVMPYSSALRAALT